MVEISRSNPLARLSLPNSIGRIAVTDPGPATRFVLRGDAGAFGLPLPVKPMHTATSGARTALWLGPDEWLVIAPDADHEAMVAALRVVPAGSSAIDVSHRTTALILEGPNVGDVLNAGCPLDFDVATFPVGRCTRTVFAKAEIMLWRQSATRFRLEAGRSFMPYIVGLLNEAVRDLA